MANFKNHIIINSKLQLKMKKFLPVFAACLLFVLKAFSFTQVVTVQNHVFTPASFTINIGDTIVWSWIDGSHTTTSLGIPAGAVAWNKNINSSSKTFTYIPAVTGIYNYKCTPHAGMGMVGNFTVNNGCPAASAQISAASATTFCKGGSVLLTSTVSANIISYQWKKNGTNISGATSSTFTANASGTYTLTVTNNCGNSATSNSIQVKVNPLPTAVVTPSGTVNICNGDSVVLQVATAASQTYQWRKNGVNIAGATSSTYTAKTKGSYTVVVTKTTTGCTKTSAVTKVTVTLCVAGTGTSEYAGIKVFPNPSSGEFHISLPGSSNSQYLLSIFDNQGNPIQANKSISKDFSFGNSLKPGVYLIQIKTDNKVVFEEKIIKE